MIVFQLTEQISIDLMIYVKVFWWHAKRFKSDLILKATFARRTLRVHKKILRTFEGVTQWCRYTFKQKFKKKMK